MQACLIDDDNLQEVVKLYDIQHWLILHPGFILLFFLHILLRQCTNMGAADRDGQVSPCKRPLTCNGHLDSHTIHIHVAKDSYNTVAYGICLNYKFLSVLIQCCGMLLQG